MNYRQHFNRRETPQTDPIPGKDMVVNNEGGYSFPVDKWICLERFLVLGTEGGSYYATEQKLTVENATSAIACIDEDWKRTLDLVHSISTSYRAPKNEPALFVLAMLCSHAPAMDYAFQLLPSIARIGTHLLHFVEYMEGFRGWGRSARKGVGAWFLDKTVEQLARQHMKYTQRDGWAQRDVLRVTHPLTHEDPAKAALFEYMCRGMKRSDEFSLTETLPACVLAVEEIRAGASNTRSAALIREHRLPREALPSELLTQKSIWEALLEDMPVMATIRNLGKLTSIGVVAPLSFGTSTVMERLTAPGAMEKMHPIQILLALMTYKQGHGMRGSLSWTPVSNVIDALDAAFYESFLTVVPTGKNTLIGLDVSASMTQPCAGSPFLSAREASAAMCMVTAKAEANYQIMGFSHEFIPLSITPAQRLDDVVSTISHLPFGGTDCALPMIWALEQDIPVEAFVIYTDSETRVGRIHPAQALEKYRQKTGIDAKLVVSAFSANEFSIADPSDPGMMDIAGLDSAMPSILADFIR